MDAVEFNKFRHECVHALMQLNESCKNTFKITSWERYDYDLDRGTLVFSHDGIPRVLASVLVTGTTSKSAGTWLWSWANGSMPEQVSDPVKQVRDFGVSERISELTQAYLPDDEYVGWAMTAVAARIMDAKGAYRCPTNDGFIYMIYNDISFADVPRKVRGSPQVTCGTHGAARATYICKHLRSNPNQAWFSQQPDKKNPWPDAWCEVCERLFLKQGEWNELNEKETSIEMVCHHCYENLRLQAQQNLQ
ncbi:MAG TPA: hypothetical protein VKR60_06760 [Candidatus Sulfotelmatobacter sp.]|nr:hypothetical protein [Candidatus Sulfotelmatobacter sp.]